MPRANGRVERPRVLDRDAFVDALAGDQPQGMSLTQAFYCDEAVYRRDLERIFFHEWLLAGHVSEVPTEGDFFTFDFAGESVIVARDQHGEVSALANVCRHRGSRVCLEARGNARRFICPYHAWTYNLDGSLLHARLMGEDFDPTSWGLKKLAVETFHGLIFISFADKPDSFTQAREMLEPHVSAFALADTKIAHREAYPVKANWKLLVENYNECYHCSAGPSGILALAQHSHDGRPRGTVEQGHGQTLGRLRYLHRDHQRFGK